jgi:hypothetical protein
MKLSDLVASFLEDNAGLVLDSPAVAKQLKRATRLYSGYRRIESLRLYDADGVEIDPFPVTADNAIEGDQDIDLTAGEWAIIEPLAKLYVDEQNAIHLEASRGLGVDPYGRSASEIAGEVRQLEDEFPYRCFVFECETV